MQIIALLPEEKQSDVHYKIMMRTWNSEKFLSPRVKKLLSIYKWLNKEEQSIFKASIYCTECDANSTQSKSEGVQE
jgi:hypothetical protein